MFGMVGFAWHAKLGDIGDNAFTHVHCLLLWHAMHATSHIGRPILRHAQENRLVAGLTLARDECMAASAPLEGKNIGNPAYSLLWQCTIVSVAAGCSEDLWKKARLLEACQPLGVQLLAGKPGKLQLKPSRPLPACSIIRVSHGRCVSRTK